MFHDVMFYAVASRPIIEEGRSSTTNGLTSLYLFESVKIVQFVFYKKLNCIQVGRTIICQKIS